MKVTILVFDDERSYGISFPSVHSESREVNSLQDSTSLMALHGLGEEVDLAIHDQGFWFLK